MYSATSSRPTLLSHESHFNLLNYSDAGCHPQNVRVIPTSVPSQWEPILPLWTNRISTVVSMPMLSSKIDLLKSQVADLIRILIPARLLKSSLREYYQNNATETCLRTGTHIITPSASYPGLSSGTPSNSTSHATATVHQPIASSSLHDPEAPLLPPLSNAAPPRPKKVTNLAILK